MPYALELLFDRGTSRAVEALWDLLKEHRTLSYRQGDSEVPHLSLLVAESLSLHTTAAVCAFVPWSLARGIQLGPLQAFTAPGPVYYLTVQEAPELRAFQRRIFHGLLPNSEGIWDYYSPDFWIPHVTLCQGNPVTQERLHQLEELGPIQDAQFTEFLVVEFDHTQRQERLRIPLYTLPPDEISREGSLWQRFDQDLANNAYFDAHEALEELWHRDRDPRQQAAIWIAVAFVHWSRGNFPGAQKLLTKLDRQVAGRAEPLMPLIDDWAKALGHHRPCPGITPTERDLIVRWARYHR